jgi:hypothetical protein
VPACAFRMGVLIGHDFSLSATPDCEDCNRNSSVRKDEQISFLTEYRDFVRQTGRLLRPYFP